MRDMYKNAGILPEVYDFCSKIEKVWMRGLKPLMLWQNIIN